MKVTQNVSLMNKGALSSIVTNGNISTYQN